MKTTCTPPHEGVKERNVGVDLAKVIAIFFVVAIHTFGRFTIDSTNLSLVWVKSLFESIALSCIDLFAIATGYLCLTSSCKYSRIVNLWISVVFWGLTMLFVSDTVLGFDVSWKYYINAIFPVLRGQYWFFTAYFMLFFFMPLINKAVVNAGKKELDRLLIAIFVFMGVYSWLGRDLFQLKAGYSFVWLLSLYIVGAYVRLYNPIKWKPIQCFTIAFLLALMPCLRQLISILIGFRIPGDRFCLASYVSPFTIGVALFIFVGCLQLTFKSKRVAMLIRALSATTFGVYLIHLQPFVWKYLWLPCMYSISPASIVMFGALSIGLTLVVFLALALIEYIRIKIFGLLKIPQLISKIDACGCFDAR